MSTRDSHPAACENCATPLHGGFCHHCGQQAHSPVRSFAHAVEEVFESFWHLDGRIFRTLRRLLLPGALARDHLSGQRAPYVAPMRLFVVLCVLTFFVGKGVTHLDGGPASRADDTATVEANRALSAATTVETVKQTRDRVVADLTRARDDIPPMMAPMREGFDRSIVAMRREAARRIVELGGVPDVTHVEDVVDISVDEGDDSWLGRQALRMQRNLVTLREDPQRLPLAFLGRVPTVLFVLVPLFALLLKLFYLDANRLYLEHLVVALYSHAFLCVALLGQFVVFALDRWISPHLPTFGLCAGLLATALWLWMPAYLLLMQKRVYAQGWLLTGVKFMALGGFYAGALFVCALGLLLVSLARL